MHVHHAVPGIILLMIGAFTAVCGPGTPWMVSSPDPVGIGTSLVLDEFALILHLQDVYWSGEGRVSVEMVSLVAACLGLVLVGFSPLGVDELTVGDVEVRITLLTAVVIHFLLLLVCVLKGKYRSALVGCFMAPVGWWAALRLARPNSRWGRRYRRRKLERAQRRENKFQAKWDPRWRWLSDAIAGAPSLPDPPPDPAPAPEPAAAPDPAAGEPSKPPVAGPTSG